MDRYTEKTLNTICFECATEKPFGHSLLTRREYKQAVVGGKVDIKGCCHNCPIGLLRGDGARISSGKKSPVFQQQLIPGDDCIWPFSVDDTWLPCTLCTHAMRRQGGVGVMLKDLDFCCLNCPANEIRDGIAESLAEASMS